MKKVVLRLFLVLLGLISGIGVSELVVRALHLAPEVSFIERGRFRLSSDLRLAYELVPNLDYHGRDLAFWDYREKSNSLGFRDVDHPIEKPQDTFRILVLGDSIVAGHHVAHFAEIFSARIERGLKERGIRTEVISFGVPGYNTGQEVELFIQRGLAFRPDLVILSYCLNDREGISHGVLNQLLILEKSNNRLSAVRLSPIFSKSALFRLVRYRLFVGMFDNPREYPEFQKYDNSDSVERALGELKRLSVEHRFGLFVAVFPFFDDLDRYAHSAEHSYVEQLCRQYSIDCVDLWETLRECQQRLQQRVGADLTHPNKLGHACASEQLMEYIKSHFDLSRYETYK